MTVATLALAVFVPQACGLIEVENVDSIDTTSTLGKGTEVTIISEKKITLGDFLSFDNASGGIIRISDEGEYSIEYNLDPQSIGDGFTFDASKFELNVNNNYEYSYKFSQNAVIPARTPISCNPSDKAAFQSFLSKLGLEVDIDYFESLLSQNYGFDFDIDFTVDNFPDLITAFKKADLNGTLALNLVPTGIPFNKFVFKKDFQISFPSFFVFSACDNALFEIQNGHNLVAKQDIDVVLGTGLSLNLTLASLDMGNGVETKGTLPLSGEKVAVSGVITVNPEQDLQGEKETFSLTDTQYIANQLKEYNDPEVQTLLNNNLLTEEQKETAINELANAFITNTLHLTPGEAGHDVTVVKNSLSIGNLVVNCGYSANKVALKNVTIKLDGEKAIPSFNGDYGFDIGNLPKELSAEGNNVELSDIQVELTVDSTLPFGFGLNANLAAISTSKTQNFPLGPLAFEANSVTKYSLGTHEDAVVDGLTYKKIDNIGSILSPVPSRIEVKDFDINFDDTQWLTIEAGKNYGGSFAAGVKAPIAFGSNTKLNIAYGMDDLDVDLSIAGDIIKGDARALIKFKAVNEIPFQFDLDLVAKDADKKPIENVKVTINKPIAAGSTANPATTDVEIEVILPAGSKIIKGLSLEFSASVDSEHAGVPLNKNQSLTVQNVKLSLPDGITTDLKNLVN